MKLKYPESVISVLFILFILLLASIFFGVKMWSDNSFLRYQRDSVIKVRLGGDWMQSFECQGTWSTSLSKDELKALDLKLRQEALVFHEGDRCVDRYPYSEGFCQTAIVLSVDRHSNTAVIQYEKSGCNSCCGTGWLTKIGEDYVEPVLHLKPIQSSYHRFSGEPSRGNGTVEYFYSNGRYRNQVEEP